MRMWMVDPRILCRSHLLGEHSEIHKHRHVFERGYSIRGRVTPVVQIEPESMGTRHDELVCELLRRGYAHRSPYTLPSLSLIPLEYRGVRVDVGVSMERLRGCPGCALRMVDFLPSKDGRILHIT